MDSRKQGKSYGQDLLAFALRLALEFSTRGPSGVAYLETLACMADGARSRAEVGQSA